MRLYLLYCFLIGRKLITWCSWQPVIGRLRYDAEGELPCIPRYPVHWISRLYPISCSALCKFGMCCCFVSPACTTYLYVVFVCCGIVFVRGSCRSLMQNVVLVLPVPVLVGHHQIHVILNERTHIKYGFLGLSQVSNLNKSRMVRASSCNSLDHLVR